eukprot:8081909-Karenia_brevis.AAC.1
MVAMVFTVPLGSSVPGAIGESACPLAYMVIYGWAQWPVPFCWVGDLFWVPLWGMSLSLWLLPMLYPPRDVSGVAIRPLPLC